MRPRRATPPQLLAPWPGPRPVEDQRHSIRTVTRDEDRDTGRANRAPRVMAASCEATIGVIRRPGTTTIAATCRQFIARPLAVFLALGPPPDLEESPA